MSTQTPTHSKGSSRKISVWELQQTSLKHLGVGDGDCQAGEQHWKNQHPHIQHPWKCSKPGSMGIGATCGAKQPWRSLLTQTILRFFGFILSWRKEIRSAGTGKEQQSILSLVVQQSSLDTHSSALHFPTNNPACSRQCAFPIRLCSKTGSL